MTAPLALALGDVTVWAWGRASVGARYGGSAAAGPESETTEAKRQRHRGRVRGGQGAGDNGRAMASGGEDVVAGAKGWDAEGRGLGRSR